MKMKRLGIALVLLALLVAPSFLQAAQTCDRQCLVTLMQNCLAAPVKHDLTAVTFDKDVKFTEFISISILDNKSKAGELEKKSGRNSGQFRTGSDLTGSLAG